VTDPSLNGLRVVDFSTRIAGPYCSKLLLDGGAEVVNTEPRISEPASAPGVPAGRR